MTKRPNSVALVQLKLSISFQPFFLLFYSPSQSLCPNMPNLSSFWAVTHILPSDPQPQPATPQAAFLPCCWNLPSEGSVRNLPFTKLLLNLLAWHSSSFLSSYCFSTNPTHSSHSHKLLCVISCLTLFLFIVHKSYFHNWKHLHLTYQEGFAITYIKQ